MIRKHNLLAETDFSSLILHPPISRRREPLAPGINILVDEERLSKPVVLLAQAVLGNPAIDCRHQNPAANSSANVELTEHLEHLLCLGKKSLEDEILLMSLHRELYDLGNSKRYSSLYKDIVLHWTQESLRIIDKVDAEDGSLVDMYVWTVFKHGGTMVAPFLNMQSSDPSDLRFQLTILAMDKFWQVKDWKYLHVLLSKFNPMEECVHLWYMTWQMVKQEYENPESLSQKLLKHKGAGTQI